MPARSRVVIGVDTHTFIHAAAALDERGALLETATFGADNAGYRALLDWAAGFSGQLTFAIEGSGSYGAGLATAVHAGGGSAIEVMYWTPAMIKEIKTARPPSPTPHPKK